MKNFFNLIKKNLFYILLAVFSVMVPFVLGISPLNRDMIFAFYGMFATFLIFLFLRNISYKLFTVVFLFILITCVMFLPQIIMFGHPPGTMIAAFFETDFKESKEFAKSLPMYSYLSSVLFLCLGLLILYLGKKQSKIRNKYILFSILSLSIFFVFFKPVQIVLKGGDFEINNTRVPIISFYTSIYHKIDKYRKDKAELEKEILEDDTWEISSFEPKYKNYVLVIGESVRRDYMSLYGFPIENSKFLKNVNGTIVEGYTSAANNTSASLVRTFVQNVNEDFAYSNNIVSLANKAGIETYWISNQGYLGEHDAPVSRIAKRSKDIIFTKKSAYEDLNYYDTDLLPTILNKINSNSENVRLFVIHLIGSHPQFEQRLHSSLHFDYVNSNLSAYIQTIEQTDELLNNIYQALKDKKEPFSMLYFADHGLGTKTKDYKMLVSLSHGFTRQCYEVPFAILSSDDIDHKHIKVNKSAYNFLDGYAKWLGISAKSLNSEYDFLSEKADTLLVFDGNNKFDPATLLDDPAYISE